MHRASTLLEPRQRLLRQRFLKCTALISACTLPFTTVGTALGDTSTTTGSSSTTASTPPAASAPTPVFRITQYPSGDNFYENMSGTLYHFIGPVSQPVASFPVGPAPTLFKANTVYVRDSSHKFYERATDGDHLVGTYTSPYEALDLHLPTPINASEIDQFFTQHSPSSPLIGYGQAFLDAQAKYGVNALYLAAHAILESYYGTSMIAVNKHNLFGYQAYDSDPYTNAAYFATFNDSIDWQAYFIARQYISPIGDWYGGSPNLDGMNVHYASDPYWAEKIAGIMNRIHAYNPADYTNAKPLSITAGVPQGPIPDPVQAIMNAVTAMSATGTTTEAVNFRSEPSTDNTPLQILQPNTKVAITGVSENWYRATVGSTSGWIYKDYVTLDNSQSTNPTGPGTTPTPAPPNQGSGQPGSSSQPGSTTPTPSPSGSTQKPNGLTTDDVNFRAQPSTSSQVYKQLQKGTALTILTVNGNWFKARVGDQVGWVYRDYAKLSITKPNPSNISVLLNGETQSYDPSPVVVNGRTLVPMRSIFENMGATVTWKGQTSTVTATKGNTTIQLTIGSNVAKVNGKTIQLDTKPLLYHDRTLVPVRFISEALGANVQWDGPTQNVFITNDLV